MSDLPFPPITARSSERDVLDAARWIAEHILEPRAEAADRAFGPDLDTFQTLYTSGFAGLAVPAQLGGVGASNNVRREVTETFGGACGVTNFTLVQHWGACGLILAGSNSELQRRVLPAMASGEHMAGVGFSHLRREGPPAMRAQPREGGYELSGYVPWFSGWGLYRHGVIAALLPDRREIFLFTSLADEAVKAGPPMALCAMQGSATVRLTFDRLSVPEENLCFVGEPGWLRNRDCTEIVRHSTNPIIVTIACIKLLRKLERERDLETIAAATDALEAELNELRQAVDYWSRDENKRSPEYTPEALKTRARTIHLAVRAAHAAVVTAGGAANLLSHAAQRYFREAMFYSVQGLTQDVMAATLEELACNSSRPLTVDER